MHSNKLVLLGAIAATTLVGCSRGSQLFVDVPVERSAQVIVLEPDALVIDGHPVRLSNVTAPQLAPRAGCWAEALAARQAGETVESLVARAHNVTATPTGGVDEYNRTFSRVTVDGVDLGQILLDDGLAATAGGVRFDWCGPLNINVARGPRVSTLARSGG